jgi:dGTPase
MNWEQLLSLRRQGDSSKRLRNEQDETRLGFDVDYDRIIFSPEFRSLQDKTQVIPLSSTDFVHTRLTHSLEVSVVARSLGRKVGVKILEKYPSLETIHGYKANDFGSIVAAAALAHDIGNPPFGHSGEKAIGHYFEYGPGRIFENQLTAAEFKDLCTFEGNANGFRVLTNNNQSSAGGLRLSYATLGAFTKYPKPSLPIASNGHVAQKKYGFFQSEVPLFCDVAQELGLLQDKSVENIFFRHPLAYLVEAADDICYTIIDFEDGINLGLVPEDYALEYLINLVKDSIDTNKYHLLKTTKERVSYLRALAISTLINDAASIFLANEREILSGSFETALLKKSKFIPQIKDILKLSNEKIYQSEEVISKEISGYEVIHELLASYTAAVNNTYYNKATSYDSLIMKSMDYSSNLSSDSLYERILGVCYQIALFSDSKAVQTFKKIKGIAL